VATGDTVWKKLDLALGHSSPTLIRFEGEDQLVFFAVPGLVGVNPDSGELLWQHAFPQRQVSTVTVNPVWNGRDTLFCANEQTGRAVKLTKDGTRTSAEELWSSRKAAIGMATPVYVGDVLIGPKQGQSPALLAIDLRTGERVWYDRTVPAGAVLYADGKLITLTQNGELGLATLTSKGPELKSRCQVAESLAFTPPTLVGTTLYVRDRRHIAALDLSPSR
jgi:outer membrane protein assembly factor BamB